MAGRRPRPSRAAAPTVPSPGGSPTPADSLATAPPSDVTTTDLKPTESAPSADPAPISTDQIVVDTTETDSPDSTSDQATKPVLSEEAEPGTPTVDSPVDPLSGNKGLGEAPQ